MEIINERLTFSDCVDLSRETIDPGKFPKKVFDHFSLPAFDENQDPTNEEGNKIHSQKLLIPAGAVLVSKLNPITPRVWLPKVKIDTLSIASTEFLVLIPKPNIDRVYLKYLCMSPEVYTYMSRRVTGSTGSHQRISPKDFLSIPISLPPLPEQRRIAGILGAFDDKIELNRRMNATLEAMARALFQSWFVDFDPVRAKMDGRWRQGESLPGLPAAWWHLFPDRLVDSELGPIPEGWRVGTLGEVADVNWGDTNTTKASYEKEGYPAFSASGFDGYLPYFDYDHEAVVVSAIGANAGRTWLTYGKWSCIKNTIRFWATEESLSTEYLYLSTYGKDTWAIRGSAQPFISQGDSRAKKIIIPTNFLGSYFGKNVSPLFHRIFSNLKENATLGDYRDSLLPVLVSFKK